MRLLYSLLLFQLVFSLAKAQITDTLNFENYYPSSNNSVIVIDSMDGIWQVGKPNKTIFNSSLSLENAAVTDTLNYYPINNDSYLYFHIDDFASYSLTGFDCDGFLNFNFKCNLDSLNDFVQIEIYSYGEWDTLKYSDYYENYYIDFDFNYYVPPFYSNQLAFTGTESNWQQVRLYFTHWALLSPPDLQRGMNFPGQLRFHFHSDGNPESMEGFMIDNMYFNNYISFCPGSVSEYQNSIKVEVYPSISSGNIYFESETENFSSITLYDFSGKEIENYKFSPTNFKTLQLSNLSTGMYFYSVDEGRAKGKFIIEK